jgi:hypothetical protein
MTWVVEVNEAAVGDGRGARWWMAFRQAFRNTDRLRVVVACDNRDHADSLVRVATTIGGLPPAALNIRQKEDCP